MAAIEVVEAAGGWTASADGRTIGQLRTITRPDGKLFLSARDCRDDAYEPLLGRALGSVRERVFVTMPDEDEAAIERLGLFGFTRHRHDYHYSVPVEPGHFRLYGTSADGVALISAADADLAKLRVLDDELRNQTPGTAGWRWTEPAFRDETFSDGFDAATYLVAVERRTGTYVGLVRIWLKTTGPRFGYIGVLPAWHRTRVTYSLLGTVFAGLRKLGYTEVTARIDSTNRAAAAIARRAGARRISGDLCELVRDGARRLPASIERLESGGAIGSDLEE